jgi:hypothetical protein
VKILNQIDRRVVGQEAGFFKGGCISRADSDEEAKNDQTIILFPSASKRSSPSGKEMFRLMRWVPIPDAVSACAAAFRGFDLHVIDDKGDDVLLQQTCRSEISIQTRKLVSAVGAIAR